MSGLEKFILKGDYQDMGLEVLDVGVATDHNHEAGETFCPFCHGVEGDDVRFYQTYPELKGKVPQILMETDNFMVLPDFAPVDGGHVLIVPKNHVTSFAYSPEGIRDEFEVVHSEVVEILGADVTLEFEHGSGFLNDEKTACGNSVYHAHWHVIPLNSDMTDKAGLQVLDRVLDSVPMYSKAPGDHNGMRLINLRDVNKPGFLDRLADASDGKPYLVFRNWGSAKAQSLDPAVSYDYWASAVVEDNDFKVPSQILRKLSAEVLHGADRARWNWKDATEDDRQIWLKNLRETYNKFGFEC